MILVRQEIGEVLRDFRQQKGRTLRQVASRASVALGYLSEVERGQKEASSEILASVAEVPGLGWRGWMPGDPPGAEPVTVADAGDAAGGGDGPVLANGLVTVAVDPTDGTFAVDGLAGFGRLVDGGDVGDTYNWCPPTEDLVVDRPESVEVAVLDRGPARARVVIVAQRSGSSSCAAM